jgi:hypothetical protein
MSIEDEARNVDLSCTFCGPGTWATWEVITNECLVFACDRHHAELSQAKIIRLERMRGKETWEEYSDDLTVYVDLQDYE